MKAIIIIATLMLPSAIARGEQQSASQEFVVKEMNSPKGIVVRVYDDKGKEILHALYHNEQLDRSTDKQGRLALYVTSQSSGPGKPIASGGFLIETSRWMGNQYVAFIHRARPDEMKPIARQSQASTGSDASDQRLTKFTNQKYGCAILVPLDVFPNPPQQNDDEHTKFLSTDRRTMLELVVDQNPRKRVLEEVYRDWVAECKKKGAIGYKILKGNWFVVSGNVNARGYYTKCVDRDNKLFIMNIEYDEDGDAIRESTMTTMSRAFTLDKIAPIAPPDTETHFRPREVPSAGAESSVDRPTISGTGFFVSADGYLLTNYHVVEGSRKIVVCVGDVNLSARVVTIDAANDLAILKVDGNFTAIPLGDVHDVSLGESVMTIGYPNIQVQGVAPKLTKGEVNALSGLRDDPRLFQISVPVQPGNSGGPLVDEHGNVIGVTSAQLNALAMMKSAGSIPQNVNYALKISYAKLLIDTVPGLASSLSTPHPDKMESATMIAATEKATTLILVWK